MTFKRELRYTVLKNKDIDKYLSVEQKQQLQLIAERIEIGRINDGKDDNHEFECVVVEHDWPMYETTWKLIEDYVTRQQ